MTNINIKKNLPLYSTELYRDQKKTTDSLVAILLCTMNGEAYLSEQLESLENQTHINWTLWVSDDGSNDRTQLILENYQSNLGQDRVTIIKGPQNGFAANFLSLSCMPAIKADFYAYADQDDIWKSNKLTRALQWLDTVPSETPALYCARTELIDAEGRHLGYSKAWTRPASFKNALTQNIGGGNTMVFNQAGRKLLQEAGQDLKVIAHDWWAYLAITGAGGQVFFDTEPSLKYRQHQNNLIGANHDFTAPLRSITRLIEGRFKNWNTHNISALQKIEIRITSENKIILDKFSKARGQNLFSRLKGVYQSGVYRQTLVGNIGLMLATLLNRI